MKKRALVTGMGMVCALGLNRHDILNAVKEGRSGIRVIRSLHLDGLSTQMGGEVTLPEDIEYPDSVSQDKVSRLSYMAFDEAWKDSGLDRSMLNLETLGIVFGTCNGSVLTLEQYLCDKLDYRTLYQDHFNGMDLVSSLTGAKGPKMLFVTACAASNHAVGYAQSLIANGDAKVVIVGGADSFSLATFSGFHALQSLHATGTSPFSEQIGISLGEGAGFLIVEEESHALGRNARIYGEILGYAFRGDAYHATSPDITGDGAYRTMSQAIAAAGINPSDLSVVCAHGTGTEANDKAETLAIKHCFERHAASLKITSTKSLYGHTLGASGVTQVIMMLDCMAHHLVPPIVHFNGSRDGCDLDYVRNQPCSLSYDYFISNSFAFGGHNVSVVLGKYKPHNIVLASPPHQPLAITDFECLLSAINNPTELKSRMMSADPMVNTRSTFDAFRLTNLRLRKYGKLPLISRLAIEVADKMLSRSDLSGYAPDQIGILMGILKGPIRTFERFFNHMMSQGVALGSAMDFPHVVMNSIAGQVSIALGIKGVNTVVAGQFSPFASLIYADTILKEGRHAILISGCDEDDTGDGAASLLLESYDAAMANHRPVLALVEGLYTASFATHDGWKDSLNRCIENTLEQNGMVLDDIDVHIGCATTVPLHSILNKPFLTTQGIVTLGATTSVLNMILGVQLLTDSDFSQCLLHQSVQTILVTAVSESGNCYSLVLKQPNGRKG